MKRYTIYLLAIFMFSFLVSGCLRAEETTPSLTQSLCSAGLDSQTVKNLKLDPTVLATAKVTCDKQASAALAAATTKTTNTVTVGVLDAPPVAPPTSTSFTDTVNALSTGIANAIASTAKQLNITVNEFIRSPAGMLLILFVFAKYFGYAIIRFITLMFFWGVITKMYVWVIRRSMNYQPTYEKQTLFWGLVTYNKKVSMKVDTFKEMDSDSTGMFVISSICYCVLTIIVMCSVI